MVWGREVQDQSSQNEQVAGLCEVQLPLEEAVTASSRPQDEQVLCKCRHQAVLKRGLAAACYPVLRSHGTTPSDKQGSPLGQPKAMRVMASSNSRIVLAWIATSGL